MAIVPSVTVPVTAVLEEGSAAAASSIGAVSSGVTSVAALPSAALKQDKRDGWSGPGWRGFFFIFLALLLVVVVLAFVFVMRPPPTSGQGSCDVGGNNRDCAPCKPAKKRQNCEEEQPCGGGGFSANSVAMPGNRRIGADVLEVDTIVGRGGNVAVSENMTVGKTIHVNFVDGGGRPIVVGDVVRALGLEMNITDYTESIVEISGAGIARCCNSGSTPTRAVLPPAADAPGAIVVVINNTKNETVSIAVREGQTLDSLPAGTVITVTGARKLVSDGVTGWFTL